MSKLGTQEDRGEDIPGTGTARAKADTGNPYGSQKPFREQGGVRAVARHEGTRPHLAALQTPSQSQVRWSHHYPPHASNTDGESRVVSSGTGGGVKRHPQCVAVPGRYKVSAGLHDTR